MGKISVDFVGGGDFGLAGHTPLHPMYVSYSALPSPPPYNSNNAKCLTTNKSNTGSGSGTAASSLRSLNRVDKIRHPKNVEQILYSGSTTSSSSRIRNTISSRNNTTRSNKSNISSLSSSTMRNFERENVAKLNIDYPNDYSNPLDHLHRPISPNNEYDSLDGVSRTRYNRVKNYYPHSSKYSPVVSAKLRQARPTVNKNNRNSYKPRVFTDHVREQPLRSFYSDPRLAVEQNDNVAVQSDANTNTPRRDSRPLSLYSSNY